MIHVVICSVNNDTNYGCRSLMLQEKARMQGEINQYHISNYTQPLSITAIKRRKTNISSRLFGILDKLLHEKQFTKKVLFPHDQIKRTQHKRNSLFKFFLQWLPEYRYSNYEPFKTVPTNFFFKVCHCHHCLSS